MRCWSGCCDGDPCSDDLPPDKRENQVIWGQSRSAQLPSLVRPARPSLRGPAGPEPRNKASDVETVHFPALL